MSVHHATSDILAASLSPLPRSLRIGLIPVTTFSILSFIASTGLLFLLTYRMIRWNRKSTHVNQFIILIYNLLFADVQQSLAFLLNAQWLAQDGIEVGTPTCWAQGWFVSTGDMGSGVWAFTIGVHTFACVIFGYRLSTASFITIIVLLWAFIYGTAIAGVAIHPNLFVRAVAWCWVDAKYTKVRLWLHYFWIFSFEFGTVIVYSAMIFAVRTRISSNFYRSSDQNRQAEDAARLMVAYPIIYLLCTLPLATLRMYSVTNPEARPTPGWFCFAGAMITSNGWMDVLLYTLTRRIELFSDEPPKCDNGLQSFGTPWSQKRIFGTETLCEYVPDSRRSGTGLKSMGGRLYKQPESDSKLGFNNIVEKRTITVESELMTASEQSAAKMLRQGRISMPGLASRSPGDDGDFSTLDYWESSSSADDAGTKSPSPRGTGSPDIESLVFQTKPPGF